MQRVQARDEPLSRVEVADAGNELVFNDRLDVEIVGLALHEDLDRVTDLCVQRVRRALVHERLVEAQGAYVE